jgi:tetratricopeptide (TPR) repeat protein
MADLLPNPRICGGCGAGGCGLKCNCKTVHYCGKECQRKDWPVHKLSCIARLDKKLKEAKREHGKDAPKVGEARYNAGLNHRLHGRYGDAERCFLEARRILLKYCSENPGQFDYILGDVHKELAQTYLQMERFDQALENGEKSAEVYRRTLGERSREAVDALQRIGTIYRCQGKIEKALETTEESLKILIETVGPEHHLVANAYSTMGICYGQMKRLDEARATHEEALRIYRMMGGDGTDPKNGGSFAVATALGNLGILLCEQQKYDEARANYEEALGIFRRIHGEKHPTVADCFLNIGRILTAKGQFEEALKMCSKGVRIKRKTQGHDFKGMTQTLLEMAEMAKELGRIDQVVEFYEEVLASRERTNVTENAMTARAYFNLSRARYMSGDIIEAIRRAKECVKVYSELGIDDDIARMAKRNLQDLETEAGERPVP